ncbi:MAG: CDP-alcohol phosphatidyltransferase family protein [Myxococcota bacterium]
MIKEKLGHRIDGWIHSFFPFLFWRRLNPDLLTVLGTLIAATAGLAFAMEAFRLAGVLLLLGGFFDLVDGVVARHFGSSTRFGAFLDSTLDRVVDILVMVGLLVFFARRTVLSSAADPAWPPGFEGSSAVVGIFLCAVILVASVVTSYAKARAELILDRMPGGLLERGERIGLLAFGALLGWLWPILWVLAIGTVVTVCQRFLYAQREMSRLDLADDSFSASRTTAQAAQTVEDG